MITGMAVFARERGRLFTTTLMGHFNFTPKEVAELEDFFWADLAAELDSDAKVRLHNVHGSATTVTAAQESSYRKTVGLDDVPTNPMQIARQFGVQTILPWPNNFLGCNLWGEEELERAPSAYCMQLQSDGAVLTSPRKLRLAHSYDVQRPETFCPVRQIIPAPLPRCNTKGVMDMNASELLPPHLKDGSCWKTLMSFDRRFLSGGFFVDGSSHTYTIDNQTRWRKFTATTFPLVPNNAGVLAVRVKQVARDSTAQSDSARGSRKALFPAGLLRVLGSAWCYIGL